MTGFGTISAWSSALTPKQKIAPPRSPATFTKADAASSGQPTPPPPESSKDTVASRRDRIIEAAIALFSERNFADVNATEIAERAGVSRRLMWYHFKTKDEIRDHADAMVLTTIGSWLPDTSRDFREIAASFAEEIARRPDYARLSGYLRLMLLEGGARYHKAAEMLHQRVKSTIAGLDASESAVSEQQRESTLVALTIGRLIFQPYFDQSRGLQPDMMRNASEYTPIDVEILYLLFGKPASLQK